MENAINFQNEEELTKYMEQILDQIRLPSQDTIKQIITSCFDVIGQHLNELEKLDNNLSLKQIALLYIYNQETINANNAVAIAIKYGHRSGAKLNSNYNLLLKKQNRIAVGGRQAVHMLENMAIIKPFLKKEALAWVEREEQIIKANT